ncbi:RNA polymerase sigma factor [Hungatella hathewayi]
MAISMEQQLETMVQQYQNLIYSICYKLIGDYFDAQDMAQETFLSAYKNLPYFDGVNERAWLCKIATNKCLDYLKSTGRRQIPTEDSYFLSLGPQPSSAQSSIEKDYLETEVRKELYDCCCQLKPPYRDVAVDYFYYEMDIGEIVAKTGKNIKTLQTQIYRAKAMLKKLYRKEDLRNG